MLGNRDWKGGYDLSSSVRPGSSSLAKLESLIDASGATFQDPFGHGTIVASVAAGRAVSGRDRFHRRRARAPRSTTCACSTSDGIGDVADDARRHRLGDLPRQGVQHPRAQREPRRRLDRLLPAPIRCAAPCATRWPPASRSSSPRATTARTPAAARSYGTISSPGNEPSAITVGSANPARHRDARRRHRQPLQLARPDARRATSTPTASAVADNVLKPDLVAPGNRVIGALSTDVRGSSAEPARAWTIPQLVVQNGASSTGLIARERHLVLRARGLRHRRPPAAGQPRPHAAARQGDPAVHRRAAAGMRTCSSKARAS